MPPLLLLLEVDGFLTSLSRRVSPETRLRCDPGLLMLAPFSPAEWLELLVSLSLLSWLFPLGLPMRPRELLSESFLEDELWPLLTLSMDSREPDLAPFRLGVPGLAAMGGLFSQLAINSLILLILFELF